MRTLAIVWLIFLLAVSACSRSESDSVILVKEVAKDDSLAVEKHRLEALAAQETSAARQTLLVRSVTVDPLSDPVWADFRASMPYHVQQIGISRKHPDSSHTIIVSEPPPETTLADLLEAVGSRLISYRVRQQPIGYGGWLKDVVMRVSGDDGEMAELTSRLSRTIFRTSYKTRALALPVSHASKPLDLDLDVRPEELQQWISGQETFLPVLGGPPQTASAVFAASASAVYFSRQRGLVAWWIPKGTFVGDLPAEARQFALDSDVIVGGIEQRGGVLVLGRERAVPVEDLPPLRFETIRLLASVEGDAKLQLAQSYERLAPFAGRMANGRDWAPIYLSPELVDTEYGSLLNITDQLLKGWSNAGQTHYENFEAYPRPSQFPFGSQPLPVLLGADELTYNWNTVGAGYTVTTGDKNVFALYRTGALPVSYFPKRVSTAGRERVVDAEKRGYEYFATLNDPNLIRVVQYAALYQIFATFHVAGSRSPIPRHEYPEEVRRRMVEELKNEIRTARGPEMAALSTNIARVVLQEEGFNTKNLSVVFAQQGIEPGTALHQRASKQFEERLQQQAAELAPKVAQELKSAVLDDSEEKGEVPLLRSMALSALTGLRNVPRRYANAVAVKASGWIHTPAVVVSYNGDSQATAIGGHNLFSRTTEVEITTKVAAGEPGLGAHGQLQVHPADASKVRELELVAARSANEEPAVVGSRLRDLVRRVGNASARERLEALKLPGGYGGGGKPAFRGANHTAEGGASGGGGWWVRGSGSAPPPEPALPNIAVIVERRTDRTIRISIDGKGEAEASTMEDATDALVQMLRGEGGGKHGVNMEMRNITADEAEGFVLSCNNRSVAAEHQLNAMVHDGRIDRTELASLAQRRYDYTKARVIIGGIERVGDRQRVPISVEILAMDASLERTGVHLEFRGDTEPGIIRTIVARLATAIHRIISDLGNAFTMVEFNLRLSHEIRALSRETGIPIRKVKQQIIDAQHDLHFVELLGPMLERPDADSRTS